MSVYPPLLRNKCNVVEIKSSKRFSGLTASTPATVGHKLFTCSRAFCPQRLDPMENRPAVYGPVNIGFARLQRPAIAKTHNNCKSTLNIARHCQVVWLKNKIQVKTSKNEFKYIRKILESFISKFITNKPDIRIIKKIRI